jgi:hypothetical protein
MVLHEPLQPDSYALFSFPDQELRTMAPDNLKRYIRLLVAWLAGTRRNIFTLFI